jgi:hypothetical protein
MKSGNLAASVIATFGQVRESRRGRSQGPLLAGFPPLFGVVAGAMRDSEARRNMLFNAEAYRFLAERANERCERLARFASHMKKR